MALSNFLAKLQNTDNIGDTLSDGVNLITQAVSKLFGFEGFPADGVFSAVVISDPIEMSFTEFEALGYTGGNIESDNSYYKFKVRIVNKRNNPHAVLEDPCDLSSTTELCQQNSLIASHTMIATRGSPGVSIGSFVKVKLDKLPNDTFNLQTGHLEEVIATNDTGASVLNSDACKSVSKIFEDGEAYDPPPTIEVNSDVEYLAQKYDEHPDIPNKENHKQYFSEYEKRNSPFPTYFKALAYLAYTRPPPGSTSATTPAQIGIRFTGKRAGVRTAAMQTELWNKYQENLKKWERGGRKGKVPLPANKKPGTHGAALAADINVDIPFALNLGTSTFGPGPVGSHKVAPAPYNTPESNKRLWEATQLPKFAKELGMVWGGDFTYYDPVHFQWTPPGWTRDDVARAALDQHSNYGTSTTQGDGNLGADTDVADVAREQEYLADEDDEALDNKLLGHSRHETDDDPEFDVLGAVGAGDSYDERAAAAAEERQRRADAHEHYKPASAETPDSSRFRGGAAKDVDFDKFDVD